MKRYIFILFMLAFALAINSANSPYLAKVWEYVPAPGQFVNTLPEYEEGDNALDMCIKAEERIANNAQSLISLGGWGGYIVFSFDHPVVNVKGQKDFIVEGNAFYADATLGAAGGGSCEPGIVMVSKDINGNGKPDDPWYELAGSEYTNPKTIHDYRITYTRPATNHVATPDPVQKYRIDTTFVHWSDNRGNEGYLVKIKSHLQPYYPEWIDNGTLTFDGARLPDNYEFKNNQYYLHPYNYGYVDNHPDTCSLAQLDIEWAVKADGTPIHLDRIHFVKVYNAMHQQCGMLGETSTEIKGARDLHPNAVAPTDIESVQQDNVQCIKMIRNGQVVIIRNKQTYNPLGLLITK